MRGYRLFLPVLAIGFTPPAGAATVAGQPVAIEVNGSVPGFSSAELAAYLARKMQETSDRNWSFIPEPANAKAPNRVVWTFKLLPVVWKGSTHNGFPSPTYTTRHLSTEVRLYLDNAYQMTMYTQSSVLGGSDDTALGDMVQHVSHALFIENTP